MSVSELDAAVANPKTTGKNAAAAAALKRASRNTKYKLPALGTETIAELASSEPASEKPPLAKMYLESLSRITNVTHRDLFAGGEPKLDTIHQGKMGNCFSLAPLGAVVHHDPKQVSAMFTRQDDGKYRVTLGKHSVTVAPPTDAEIAMSSSNEDGGIWVNLYEKALGQLRNEERPPAERVGSPIDALARGGSAGTMLAYITGNEITRFSFKFAKDETVTAAERETKISELRNQLQAAVRQHRLMTCGTLKPTTPGIVPNHAYAVLGYDAKADAVKLWNPYGSTFKPKGEPGLKNGYPQSNGVLEVPVQDFVQQFSGMAFEVMTVTAQ